MSSDLFDELWLAYTDAVTDSIDVAFHEYDEPVEGVRDYGEAVGFASGLAFALKRINATMFSNRVAELVRFVEANKGGGLGGASSPV